VLLVTPQGVEDWPAANPSAIDRPRLSHVPRLPYVTALHDQIDEGLVVHRIKLEIERATAPRVEVSNRATHGISGSYSVRRARWK